MATDRPDFTEASSTVGRGRWLVELGYLYVRDRSAEVVSDQHVLPESLFRYGVTDDFELRLEYEGFLFAREQDRLSGLVESEQGGTDMTFGFKRQLTKQDGWVPESAFIASLLVPTGSPARVRGAPIFTSGQVDPAINLLCGWELSEKLELGASTGATWLAEDDDQFVVIHQSLVANYSLTPRLRVFGEWFAFFFDGAADSRPEQYFHGGTAYLLGPNAQLDWHAGVGMSEAADDFFTGVGFSFRR